MSEVIVERRRLLVGVCFPDVEVLLSRNVSEVLPLSGQMWGLKNRLRKGLDMVDKRGLKCEPGFWTHFRGHPME